MGILVLYEIAQKAVYLCSGYVTSVFDDQTINLEDNIEHTRTSKQLQYLPLPSDLHHLAQPKHRR